MKKNSYFKRKKKSEYAREIIINVESLETRVAVLQDGVLEDYHVERSSEERIVGSVFKGKVQNLEDGLQAAFVDIGMKKNAFIHYWDMVLDDATRLEQEEGLPARGRKPRKKKYDPGEMSKRFPVGTEIVVQVTKDAIGTKGPRVTANLSLPGRFLVMMPDCRLKGVSRKIADDKERARLKKMLSRFPVPENVGIIIRTAGAGARKTAFARDLRTLIETWKVIADGIENTPAPCTLYSEPDLVERVVRDSLSDEVDRILIDDRESYDTVKEVINRLTRRTKRNFNLYDGETPIFDYFEIEEQLSDAFRRKVWLPGGGYLVFDETEALVAIDINTGRHKGSQNQEESITQVNVESALEIARQVRLRNIGGLLVIDFIDMKQKRNRNLVYRTLKDAVKKDKARTNLLHISDLGLLEMTRQRTEESIRASMFMDCPYCRGRGNVKSDLSMSVTIQRHLAEVMRKHRREGKEEEEDVTIKIAVHPMILDRLRRSDEDLLIGLEKKFQAHLTFVSDHGLHVEEFIIGNGASGEVYYTNVEAGKSRRV